MPQSRSSGFSGGGFSGGGAMASGDRTGRADKIVKPIAKPPVTSVVSAPRIDPIEATPAPPEVAPAAPAAAMVDPYVSAADTARMSANAFKADTPDHSMFNDAWDHAVHNKARPEMLDRSNAAWLTGVTNGLQYRRSNPRKVVAD